jgi:transglutaminase-like putative cysteine protease
VIEAGHAFCMGKASAFVSLCRAAGIPARIGFQQLHCPDKEFMSEEVRALWRDRPLPWHSLGEAYVNGRWLKLDATIPAKVAAEKGRPYVREFDGVNDIPTVEGPIVKEIGSFADYPKDVAEWYERMARETMAAVASADARQHERNSAAHPSGVKTTPKAAEAYIEDLVENVLKKFPA